MLAPAEDVQRPVCTHETRDFVTPTLLFSRTFFVRWFFYWLEFIRGLWFEIETGLGLSSLHPTPTRPSSPPPVPFSLAWRGLYSP